MSCDNGSFAQSMPGATWDELDVARSERPHPVSSEAGALELLARIVGESLSR